MFHVKSAADIIQAFGGTGAFASVIGTTQQNVTNMKARDSIPPGFWRAVVEAAADRGIAGITLDVLADLAATRRPVSSTPSAAVPSPEAAG